MKATFSGSLEWPLYTGLTVFSKVSDSPSSMNGWIWSSYTHFVVRHTMYLLLKIYQSFRCAFFFGLTTLTFISIIVQIISFDWGISSTPLKRSPLIQWKSGLTRGVVSLTGHNLIVFYYLNASEIWCNKSGNLWLEWPQRGTTVSD